MYSVRVPSMTSNLRGYPISTVAWRHQVWRQQYMRLYTTLLFIAGAGQKVWRKRTSFWKYVSTVRPCLGHATPICLPPKRGWSADFLTNGSGLLHSKPVGGFHVDLLIVGSLCVNLRNRRMRNTHRVATRHLALQDRLEDLKAALQASQWLGGSHA